MKSAAYISITLQRFFVLIWLVNCISARRYPEEGFFSINHFDDQQNAKINAGLEKLIHSPQWVDGWPGPVEMGQVSGVATDLAGHVFVLHRATNVWDANTFNERNVYQGIGEPPLQHPTIFVFNEDGELIHMWGENLFYMPHGITVDQSGNVWVTDVALHQVFKFKPDKLREPVFQLGEKFVPGDDDDHFCKPSAVAVHSSGDFFVADGYCNARIIKYAPDGTKILQWGRRFGQTPFTFNVPHALTIAEDKNAICTADRERGRIACFRVDNGTYIHSYSHWLIGPRLFSVAYSPIKGGRLYLVNGPALGGGIPVRGYVIDYTSGRLIQTFAPPDGFTNPHDIAASPDGSAVYVAELNPSRVYMFADDVLRNNSAGSVDSPTTAPAKPTATVEVSGVSVAGGWGEWGGAAGAALGATGAALLAMSAIALRNARNRGRKGVSRRRWEYGHGEFKLRRLLERRRFTRVHTDDSEEEPALLPTRPPTNA